MSGTASTTLHTRSALRQGLVAICLLWLLAALTAARTQPAPAVATAVPTAPTGAPLLENFAPEDIDAYPQNWAVVQDSRGIIYVGNGEAGVLEYDGSQWRHIAVPRQSAVRSLGLGADGRIYVGCVGDFGYLAPDALGRMRYVSLLDHVAPSERGFAEVWTTLSTSHGMYFSTSQRLFRLNGDAISSWAATHDFHLTFVVNDQLYIRQSGIGLQRIVGDALELIPGGERFADDKIYVMVPWAESDQDQSILLATRRNGWLIFDGETYRPWQTSHPEALKSDMVYGALWLADGRLAVATLLGGVALLDRHGNETARIRRTQGLIGDTVYAMTEDREGGLWLTLDNGVARVEVNSALTRFNQLSGLEGSVIAIHQHRGDLYAGTSAGLFRLEGSGSSAHFVQMRNVPGQVWTMIDLGTSMLVGGVEGAFEITADGTTRQHSEEFVQILLRPDPDSDRILAGRRDGLYLMHIHQGQRTIPDSTKVAPGNIQFLRADNEGNVWISALDGSAARVNFVAQADGSTTTQVTPQRTPTDPGSDTPYYAIAGEIDGSLAFSTEAGIQRIGTDGVSLVPDPRFAGLFDTIGRRPWAFAQDASGAVWMYVHDAARQTKAVVVAVADANGMYHWKPLPMQALVGKAINAIELDAAPGGAIWLAANDGLYRYDPRRVRDDTNPAPPLVRNVATRNGRLLWGGDGEPASAHLEWSENSVRIDYAQPRYDSGHANRFQVMLEGMDTDWSPWSTETYRDYTNLPEANYRFRLRARDAYGRVSHEALFRFDVLPPWYRSWWAYLGGFAVLLLTIAGAMRWRVRALSLRNEELLRLVDERTSALEQANAALVDQTITDALTGLKNRRYVTDHVEHDVAQVQRNFHRLAPSAADHHDSNIHLLFLMMDMDHFKQVNDRYGHAAGDLVLSQLRDLLLRATRDSDTPVRWGGEEFLVLARFANASVGPVLAERIRAAVEQHPFDLGNGQFMHRTCSIGFAYYPMFAPSLDHFSWEDVVNLADQCLYQAKAAGRNRWVGVIPARDVAVMDEPQTLPVELDVLVTRGYLQKMAGGPSHSV